MLTDLFTFILCFFDISFLVAHQASRQGALRGRSVLSLVTGRYHFPTSNTHTHVWKTRQLEVWTFNLLLTRLLCFAWVCQGPQVILRIDFSQTAV